MTTVPCGIAYDSVASYPIMILRSYDDNDNDGDNDRDNHNSDHDSHNDDMP
jgi:hypothetical protein